MREFFFSTRLYKQLPTTEIAIQEQLEILEKLVKKISGIDHIFKTWFVNNATSSKPLLDYPFPSESAYKYLFNRKKEDEYKGFLLWNGEDKVTFSSLNFDSFNISMSFYKELTNNQVIKLFKIFLELVKFQYIYLNNNFFADINIFPHRLSTTSICYVPKIIDENQIPHLYQKIEINNELNQGMILIFDENLFDESDSMKKKIQENSIALVDLNLIPEAELNSDFFEIDE